MPRSMMVAWVLCFLVVAGPVPGCGSGSGGDESDVDGLDAAQDGETAETPRDGDGLDVPRDGEVPETEAGDDGGDTGCTCNDGNPCTDDSCEPVSGRCIFVANTSPCDDGDACTTGERCTDGRCSTGAPLACNDGNSCTTGDRCAGGACTGTAICNDGNFCTDDSCNPTTGACIFTANSAPCEDGNPCTTSDRCSGGACWPGAGLPAWYPDADGDGFGSPSGTPVCAASMPAGYADNTQDCCDADGRVRPDQPAYFADSYTCGAGSSFDYNCNGVEEQRWSETGGGCRWGTGSCVLTVGWQGGDVPACGVSRSWVSGCSSMTCSPTVESRTQECR